MPNNFTVIVTCKLESNSFKRIVMGDETWYKMNLKNMNQIQSKSFIENYLLKYNKVWFKHLKLNKQ